MKRCIDEESKKEAEQSKPKKVKQLYTIRDVIKQNHQELVEEEIPYNPVDSEYIGCYQRAVTTVQNKMTEEELEDAQKVADSWNEEGVPSDIQLRQCLLCW